MLNEPRSAMAKLKTVEELFKGRHFDRDVVILCVRWYLRFKLSLRDLVEMMVACSMGPCIAVGEADPTNIDMETLVNGECRQRFNTRDMVFSFGEYLEYLSRDFT